MARGNMSARTPSGEGDLVRAHQLLGRVGIVGQRIRLNPGGGEYEAVLLNADRQAIPDGWVRLRHQRDGFARPTINVVPPSVEVRILD